MTAGILLLEANPGEAAAHAVIVAARPSFGPNTAETGIADRALSRATPRLHGRSPQDLRRRSRERGTG